MPLFASQLVVEVKADTDQAERGLDRLEGNTRTFGDRMKGLAGFAAAGLGAAGVAGFLGKAITGASDLNEQMSKAGVVFGPAAGTVSKAAKQMADDFGYPITQFYEAAGGLGLIGKASGLSQQAAANLGVSFSKLAADASSFYNVPLEEALGAIQSGLVGEAEPMRRFGVLLNEEAVQQEAFRLGLAKSKDEMTDAIKVQARASLITKGMTDATGDLARTQDSFANRMRELQGRATNFAATVGQHLLPVILKGLDIFESLGDITKSQVAAGFDAVRNAIQPIIPWFQNAVKMIGFLVEDFRGGAANADAFAEVLDNIFGNTGKLIPVFRKLYEITGVIVGFIQDNARPIMIGLAAAIGTGLVVALHAAIAALAGLVGGLIVAVAPFVAVGAAIAAVVAGVIYAYQHFEGFRDVIGTVSRVMQQFASNVMGWIGGAVEWIVKIWPQVSEAFEHVVNVIKTLVAVVLGPTLLAIGLLWRSVGDDIVNIVKTAFRVIGETINAVLDVFRGVVQFVLALINGDWSKAWNSAMAIVRGVWDLIFGLVRGAGNVIQSILGGFVSIIGNGIEAAFKAGVHVLVNLPGWILEAVVGVGSTLVGVGKNLIEGLWNGIMGMKDWIIDKLKGFVSDVIPGPIKKVLSIFSPSRVTAGLGEQVARGLVVGIERGTEAVSRASEAMAGAAVPSVPTGAVPGAFSGAGAGPISLSISVQGSGSPQETATAVIDAGYDLIEQLVREIRSR